jgi:hypothetical protein
MLAIDDGWIVRTGSVVRKVNHFRPINKGVGHMTLRNSFPSMSNNVRPCPCHAGSFFVASHSFCRGEF